MEVWFHKPTMTDQPSSKPTIDSAKDQLREAAKRIAIDPETNSVFELARSLFYRLESDAEEIETLSGLIQDVYQRLVEGRAGRFRDQHFSEGRDIWDNVDRALDELAGRGWETFQTALQKPRGGVVFTAHPTFALSQTMREHFSRYVVSPSPHTKDRLFEALQEDGRDWSARISLKSEHEEAQNSILQAQSAMAAYAARVLDTARTHFPDQWMVLSPSIPSVASWVGYDLDGRSDINWYDSFALRLTEKATQLGRYVETLEQIDEGLAPEDHESLKGILDQLRAAHRSTAALADQFSADLSDPETLVDAANTLTSEAETKLVSITPITNQLKALARSSRTRSDTSLKLLQEASVMDSLQLGTARIHLRLNAAQIRTVINRDLGLETESRDLGRIALSKLSELAAVDTPAKVSFADLFLEQSTARRQFLLCAQFLKHVDSGSTIRFLIAESENPATVMGALYLARQYGVDAQLDISPLFETPEALETGGRFIERLLAEQEFRTYLKKRGYLSVQLGFSDAGRFIGQIAANMAIERIHNQINQALAKSGLDIDLLIFNTHGESMGRGAWPGSFTQRFNHLLTPWTRRQSRQRHVAIRHEVSFQGGDGFLHFANRDLAHATYAAFTSHLLSDPDPEAETDPFYSRTDLVWDFYRSLRRWQERMFNRSSYATLLTAFATNFLIRAGSRKRQRVSGPSGPRSLRAISNNASLQQIGAPLNTAGGIGSALRREQDQIVRLIDSSPRMTGLVQLAATARAMTSLPALRAYAHVYDPSLWVALARRSDPDTAVIYRRVYYSLRNRTLSSAIEAIANELSIDFSKFDRMLAELEDVPTAEARHEWRLDIHIMHAIRQALMMRALSLAGQLPSISTRHETSVEDIVDLIQSMQLAQAVEILGTIFPASRQDQASMSEIREAGHLLNQNGSGYDQIHRDIIAPLKAIDGLFHRITLVTCQWYGAYG
jgi:phosphoenolpyruvate carboxylase